MGKPYWSELKLLPETFAWAQQLDISGFIRAVKACAKFPLISVGSGGSYSAAALAAFFHNRYVGQLAQPYTPLQAGKVVGVRECGVLVLSAAGTNPDVKGIFQRILDQEPKALTVLCLTSGSPLAKLCWKYEFVSCSDFDLPCGKDGFVATNSLIAFATILRRAYSHVSLKLAQNDMSFEDIVTGGGSLESWCDELRNNTRNLWTRPNLIVLHGYSTTYAAALDLESKFSEAAVGAVQVTDFRNFAHGRHNWLDKKGPETGVLAFVTDEDRTLATRTLALLPKSVPVGMVPVRGSDGMAALAATATSLYLAGIAADARGIDPGRPGVPAFGRRIYNLNTWSTKELSDVKEREKIAIERKLRAPLSSLNPQAFDYWHQAYTTFIADLGSTTFEALVLDYDGTLCDEKFRFGTLPENIAKPLNEILTEGIPIGIATGRGKSVRKALRECLAPAVWPQVVVAYHNGSQVSTLDDEAMPVDSHNAGQQLTGVAHRIEGSQVMRSLADYDSRTNQISIVVKNPADTERVYKIVCDLTSPDFINGISCVRSSHSIDVLAPGVSKLSLFPRLVQKTLSGKPCFLCIGDLGSWPGNDFSLLWTPYSLSVNEVSWVPDRCWNIAPRGYRNSQATAYLLRLVTVSGGSLRFNTEIVSKERTSA